MWRKSDPIELDRQPPRSLALFDVRVEWRHALGTSNSRAGSRSQVIHLVSSLQIRTPSPAQKDPTEIERVLVYGFVVSRWRAPLFMERTKVRHPSLRPILPANCGEAPWRHQALEYSAAICQLQEASVTSIYGCNHRYRGHLRAFQDFRHCLTLLAPQTPHVRLAYLRLRSSLGSDRDQKSCYVKSGARTSTMKRYLAFGSRNGVCAALKKKSTHPDHASLMLSSKSSGQAPFQERDSHTMTLSRRVFLARSPAKIVNGLRLRTVYALVALNAVSAHRAAYATRRRPHDPRHRTQTIRVRSSRRAAKSTKHHLRTLAHTNMKHLNFRRPNASAMTGWVEHVHFPAKRQFGGKERPLQP
ncbi:hypothetical protein V8E55_003532 [Tylopilus felleus]